MRFLQFLMNLFRSLIGGGSTPPIIPEPPLPPIIPDPPTPTDPVEDIKKQLFDLHNSERTKRGIPAFNRRQELDNSAQKHNDWMAERNNLTHSEPGRDIGKRVSEAGYRWNWVGENIAEGQRNATEVMNSWMNSSGHRANILNGRFKDVGFGVTKKNNTWWWTTNFGG